MEEDAFEKCMAELRRIESRMRKVPSVGEFAAIVFAATLIGFWAFVIISIFWGA